MINTNIEREAGQCKAVTTVTNKDNSRNLPTMYFKGTTANVGIKRKNLQSIFTCIIGRGLQMRENHNDSEWNQRSTLTELLSRVKGLLEPEQIYQQHIEQRLMRLMLTILTTSGYIGSVSTPRFVDTYSTISLSAALFTSFHLRSDRGSCTKSNNTQHCFIFCKNKSSLSPGVASTNIIMCISV